MIVPRSVKVHKTQTGNTRRRLLGFVFFMAALLCAEKVFFKIEFKTVIIGSSSDVLWPALFVLFASAWVWLNRGSLSSPGGLSEEDDFIIRTKNTDTEP